MKTIMISAKEYQELIAKQGKQSKYRNKPTEVDGIKFHSAKEAKRWGELKLMERNGEIRNLKRQKEFSLVVRDELICKYRCDFAYEKLATGHIVLWCPVIEDVKGAIRQRIRDKRTGKMKTISNPAYEMFLLKKKLMKAIFRIEIQEL